jgi:uncharacterized protein (TIGR03437 family)
MRHLHLIGILLAFIFVYSLTAPWPSSAQQPTVTDHKTTGGPIPSGCASPMAKTVFAPTDDRVYSWAFVSGAAAGDAVRWDFIQPSGALYTQSQLTLSNTGNVCFWAPMLIAGAQAANLPGNWQVRVFYKGTQILTQNFTITSGNCAQPQTGTVSWWPLEGNANDVRGSNHGALFGSPSFTTGKVAQGLRFDGTNDHVRVPASSSLNIGTSSGFTLAAWIQPDDTQPGPVLEYNNENVNQFSAWGVHIWVNTGGNSPAISPGELYVNIHDAANTSHPITAKNVITAGVFQHIALTYDKTSGVARLYVNGVEKSSANLGSFTPQTSYPLFMGYRPAGANSTSFNRFKGIIDEVELFNRALSASEIQAIACVGGASDCPTVSGINPTSGAVGSGVTITGSNFTGVTAVRFANNVSANFTVVNATTITATVPAGAVTGAITISKPNCPDAQTSVFTVTTTGGGNCIQPPGGMVGWWPGDDNANDIQGPNNGTLQNGATFAAGQVGQAFSFDGTDDYVSTNLDAQPSVMPSTTWDAWVFPTRVNLPSVRQGIMSIDTGGFARSVLIEMGTANFGVFTGAGVWQPAPVTLNQWQHIAVVYTPTGIRFYKNGVEFVFSGGANTIATTGRFQIGRFPGFPQYFQGRIDEVEVFNRALSQAEIQAIFNAGSAGKCKSGGANCPTISGFSPTSGAVGGSVTITGSNFTGVTSVMFANNVAANFTINSNTQITTIVPSGAVTGPITISKPNCPDVQTTGSFTVTTSGQCISVSIPTNLTGSPNATLTVPINVSDTTGRGALSYDAALSFNTSVLRLQNPPFDRTGTLSANLNVTTNSPSAGRLNISGFSSSPLTGSGVLLYLKFDVIGSLNSCSDLNWISFRFNEGAPCSTTSNGRACATGGGSIAGAVSYCASSPVKPVPGVTITAAGAPQGSATTDNSGNYQLPNLGAGPYTLTPAKTGDANGITSFDAAQIAQHVVQIITLNACQQAAADTSGNGQITSFDAAFIAQYVVGITNPDNKTGTWKFLPPSRAYASLNGSQTAQNFDAVLMGELTGNWMASGGNNLLAGESLNRRRALSPAQVAISLPQMSAATGSSVTIPITVGDLTGRNFLSFDFDLTYDASVLQAQQQPTDSTDTLARNLTITANATPGRLRVSAFGAQAMTGAGTLLKLKFNVTGAAGTGTALTWQQFIFNETAQTSLTNGRVNSTNAVASVSAASFLGQSLASESIVAAFGTAMATRVEVANTLPLPTTLAGTTVRVRDSAGTERLASLFFVAPTQINFQIPPGTAIGQATITVTSGDGTVSGGVANIASVAPGLFSANASGQGVAAATALRVKADGTQVFEPVARFDAAQNRFVAAPIDLGPDLGAASDQLFLILFGTGWRNRSALTAVTCGIGGVNSEVLFAGEQGGFVGLDQMNVRLPRSLAGRGEVEVAVTVDGRAANTVRVSIK